jgi:hypothetical protein
VSPAIKPGRQKARTGRSRCVTTVSPWASPRWALLSPSRPPPSLLASGPTITSLKAKQSGNKVTVTSTTKRFKIDTADVGKSPKAGKGHEHFSMDGGRYDYPKYSGANGKLAKQLGAGLFFPRPDP